MLGTHPNDPNQVFLMFSDVEGVKLTDSGYYDSALEVSKAWSQEYLEDFTGELILSNKSQ